MARYRREEESDLDSDEELTFSSEEEFDSDKDCLHFEERPDPNEDILSDEYENNGKPVKNKQATQSWKTETDADTIPETLRFLPAKQPGLQLRSCDAHTPMSLFKQFFSETAVSTLCLNTNSKSKLTDINNSEMYRYFGLLFYMAMVNLRSIGDYWRQDLFSVPFPATVMSRDRFQTITRNFHTSHPDEDEDNDRKKGTAEYDHLFRVRSLMDTIRHACKAVYHPRKILALKEGMPNKLGFKLFVLMDSSNGYTVDFAVSEGNDTFPTDHGLSYDAVTSLLDREVLGSGYHVYMDNFDVNPKLLKDLFALKFGACGTYIDDRKVKKSARGSIRWTRDEHLLFVKWMDTREVSICSTIHAAYTGDTVQKRVKTQNGWMTKSFPCPAPVTAYKQHKEVHNMYDEMVQYYTAQHKTKKWYRKLFLHFLDIAATNAFFIHKELYGTMNQKEFMEELIEELCSETQKQ